MPRVMTEASAVCADGRSQSDQYSSVATAILNGWRPHWLLQEFRAGHRIVLRMALRRREDESNAARCTCHQKCTRFFPLSADARDRTDLNEKLTVPDFPASVGALEVHSVPCIIHPRYPRSSTFQVVCFEDGSLVEESLPTHHA